MIITKIQAREILESRGFPTISTTVWLDTGVYAKGDVPAGASTGDTEVLEMRDGDKRRYLGKGVLKAVDIVNNEIAQAIVGKNFNTQKELDDFLIQLDGTPLKTRLGGNSILSVSMAFCRATALSRGIQLYEYFREIHFGKDVELHMPTPQVLIMEGGAHGNWATDFQEFMVIPQREKFPNFKEMLRAGAEIFHATHDILVEKGYSATVGFEGAFAPIQIQSNKEAFDIILQGIEKAGYIPGEQFKLGFDIASSEFYDSEKQKYNLKREGLTLSSEDWLTYQKDLFAKYPVQTVEDPFNQEDWTSWSIFTKDVGDKYTIIGDDFYTTNVERIKKGIASNATNAVLIKLNQIGTVTETLNAIKLTQDTGWLPVISHRGGETNDDMIADLVVGTNSGMSKFGGPDRGERLAKYNRLLEIEELI
jgi:enolase